MHRASIIALIVVALSNSAQAFALERKESRFTVAVTRGEAKDGLVFGTLRVEGKELGKCYENAAKKIPAGTYNGVLRYKSAKNFVQGPGGLLGKSGDFLLEVAGVPDRSDILFHAGSKPEHSDGCILCGPPESDGSGRPVAPAVLKSMRLLFYDGQDKPIASPDKSIVIEIKD